MRARFVGKYWHLFVIFFIALGAVVCIMNETREIRAIADRSVSHVVSSTTDGVLQHKPDHRTVKSLYLTAYSASNPKKRAEIIDLIDRTELNAVVIDIKDYTGNVLYATKIPTVVELDTFNPIIKDFRAVVDDFHAHDIYVIARQTVFQDPVLARAKPEWAIKTASGDLWRDYKGLSWVDPSNKAVWRYNMAIAREAIRQGIDEINFDYVRFPSDGNIRTAVYASGTTKKEEVMSSFYRFVQRSMRNQPAYTSLDLFGLVLEAHNFDLNIGQTLRASLDTVDYICPMTYPSHYPAGHLGFSNPAEHPFEVVKHGLDVSAPLMASTTTKLRPWVQAFDMGAVYGADKIRAQTRAIEQASTTDGYMLWNASNRYTSAGLLVF